MTYNINLNDEEEMLLLSQCGRPEVSFTWLAQGREARKKHLSDVKIIQQENSNSNSNENSNSNNSNSKQ